MRLIHIEKVDKLMEFTLKLKIITYLMLLVDEEENCSSICGYEDILKDTRSYLTEQNIHIINQLHDFIHEKNFTNPSK